MAAHYWCRECDGRWRHGAGRYVGAHHRSLGTASLLKILKLTKETLHTQPGIGEDALIRSHCNQTPGVEPTFENGVFSHHCQVATRVMPPSVTTWPSGRESQEDPRIWRDPPGRTRASRRTVPLGTPRRSPSGSKPRSEIGASGRSGVTPAST